jgi:hypothetical protein
MRRVSTFFAVLAIAAVVVSGCGDDKAPPFANMVWKLRCEDMGGCTGYPRRDVNNYNGEAVTGSTTPLRISCEVQPRGATKEFFFSVYEGSTYGMELRNASFTGNGGSVGGSCLVRVLEGGNNWEAPCGSNDPSPAQPCKISGDFTIASTNPDAPGVLGRLQCVGLPLMGNPSTVRELTSADEVSPREPVVFNFQNCAGL